MLILHDSLRMDPAYAERLAACGLDRVDQVLARTEGRVVAWSRTTDTLFVPGVHGRPGFYLKRYFYPTWKKRLRGFFRGTFLGFNRARAEFRSLKSMAASGVPTVRPVAVGTRRLFRMLTACFLITEEVPGAANLTTFAQEVRERRRMLPPGLRRQCVRSLAAELAAMHAEGVSHGQLFWRNILIRRGVSGNPEYFFLDAQPLSRFERVGHGPTWWIRELAQLTASAVPYLSRTDAVRFMHAYFRVSSLTPLLKQHLREMLRLAQEHDRHERQRIKMDRLFTLWNRQLVIERAQIAPRPSEASA